MIITAQWKHSEVEQETAIVMCNNGSDGFSTWLVEDFFSFLANKFVRRNEMEKLCEKLNALDEKLKTLGEKSTEESHGVEIIRCKDCIYNLSRPDDPNACCELFYGLAKQNGFCHRAERRKNAAG